jgi:photosystem II stability/assembly factor-like uncharacterized protein
MSSRLDSGPDRRRGGAWRRQRAAVTVTVMVAILGLATVAGWAVAPPAADVLPASAAAVSASSGDAAPPASPSPAVAVATWWTLPIWGGDIRSLVVAPGQPDVVLAGTTTGQLYVSHNGGASWTDAGAPLPFPGWVVSSLRWDPNRTGRLWVALWGVWGGGQVAYSDDLGKSWVGRSAGLPAEAVYSLALVPGREGRLFAGTLSGVWGSDDGGGSWRRLTADLPDVQKVTSLVVDPTRPDTIIAGTWRQAYRSTDGGATWSGVFDGMVLDTEVFSFTPIPEHPGEIWASSCGWVYQTLDRGDHWVRFKDGLDERRTLSFAAPATGPLLAGTVSGVFASADAGKSWHRISDPALSVSALAVDPARPQRILVGTEGAGMWLSTDGGGDFFRASRGITATRVGALAAAGGELLVAINDAGPVSGVYASRDGGKSFTNDFSPLPTVLGLTAYGGRVYAATEHGLYERRGADWHRLPELGTARVEQLLAEAGSPPIARTSDALYELSAKGVFERRPYKHGPPLSAALYGGALWVSDAQGVYRLTADANHTVPAPSPGRLLRLGDDLLLAGASGAWARPSPEGDWVQLTAGAAHVIATGDSRYGALLQSGDSLRLYDRDTHSFRPLPVPVPARDVGSALVIGDRIYLGTSGYGVITRVLD